MDAPFDIYQRTVDWLVSNINSDELNRHDLDTGAYLAEFALVDNFPQQVTEAANGNVLVGNFGGTQVGVVEFTPAGAVVDVYAPVTGNRGVYELPNGNILTSNGSGVYEIDRDGNVVETKIEDVSGQYIELIQIVPSIALNKTVGADPDECAATAEIQVEADTNVYYCYEVSNTGSVALTLHDLQDSELGVILNDFPFNLQPGASAFLTVPHTILTDTVNMATWTAFNPGPSDVVSATSAATVTVVTPSIALEKTVGLDADECAVGDVITVTVGTAVTYCYSISNTGSLTVTTHHLVDSELGVILSGFPFVLSPGATAFLTQTATINETTVNTATWTAYTAAGSDASAVDSATVFVEVVTEDYTLYLPVVVYNQPAALPPQNR
jgi:hypothetical protein